MHVQRERLRRIAGAFLFVGASDQLSIESLRRRRKTGTSTNKPVAIRPIVAGSGVAVTLVQLGELALGPAKHSDDLSIPANPALPVAVTQDDDRVAAWNPVVVLSEQSTEVGPHAQQAEIIA